MNNQKPMDNKYKTENIIQYTTTFICSLVALGFSATLSWSSPAQGYLILTKTKEPFTKEDFQLTTFVSLMGNILGFFLNPILVEALNTKLSMLIFAIPQFISWLIIAIKEDFYSVCISRFMSSLAYSGAISASTEYLLTISNAKNRGRIFCIMNVISHLGCFLPLYLSICLTYLQINLVLMIIPILFFLGYIFIPNPSYFQPMNKWTESKMKKGDVESEIGVEENNLAIEPIQAKSTSAEKPALKPGNSKSSKLFVERKSDDNKPKSTKNSESRESSKRSSNKSSNKSGSRNSSSKTVIGEMNSFDEEGISRVCLGTSQKLELFTKSNNRKGFMIMLCITALDIFGGHLVVAGYTEEIIVSPMRDLLMQNDVTVFILTGLKILGILISALLVDRVERKDLLLWCTCVSFLATSFVGTYYYFARLIGLEEIEWFLLSSMTISEVSSSIGIGNTFFVLQGELFADNVRTIAISVINIIYLSTELLVMTMLIFLETSRLDLIFWISSCICLILSIIIYFFVPKIRGKNLQEIQEELLN